MVHRYGKCTSYSQCCNLKNYTNQISASNYNWCRGRRGWMGWTRTDITGQGSRKEVLGGIKLIKYFKDQSIVKLTGVFVLVDSLMFAHDYNYGERLIHKKQKNMEAEEKEGTKEVFKRERWFRQS